MTWMFTPGLQEVVGLQKMSYLDGLSWLVNENAISSVTMIIAKSKVLHNVKTSCLCL